MAGRRLTESNRQTNPLKVDREAGVIFGVRILGPVSKNTYGVNGVTETEYSETAHTDARRLYEGVSVRLNHIREPNKERQVEDKFGKLHKLRTVIESDGPATYGDLHYLKSHDMAARVCEDVERGLGMFGLSHDAYAGKERVDKGRKRLVIESLKKVNSVDLVDGPATNRNLWESTEQPTTTFGKILESLKDLPPGKAAWRRLLDDQTATLGAPVLSDADDPDAALDAGFRAAILAVLDDEGLALDAKKSRIGMLLTVQDKLRSGVDPAEPTEKDMATETPKAESVDAAEFARLKAENTRLLESEAKAEADKTATAAVRKLCESVKFNPTDVQLTALKGLPDDAARKALIESFKPEITPRSGYSAGKHLQEGGGEYKPAPDAKTLVARIRR